MVQAMDYRRLFGQTINQHQPAGNLEDKKDHICLAKQSSGYNNFGLFRN